MLEAGIFAAIGQVALVVGALLVWRFRTLTRAAVVGSLMAFGAGAVISAVSTDLVAVAYDEAGGGATALGIGIGGLGYFLIITLLERSGAREKPEAPLEEAAQSEDGEVAAATPTEARNLFVGMIIDGVPESVAVGLSVHLGSVGVSHRWPAGGDRSCSGTASWRIFDLQGSRTVRLRRRHRRRLGSRRLQAALWPESRMDRANPVDRRRRAARGRDQRDGPDSDPRGAALGRRARRVRLRLLSRDHLDLWRLINSGRLAGSDRATE